MITPDSTNHKVRFVLPPDCRLNENETMNVHYNTKVNLENGVLYLLKYLEDVRVVQ